MKDSRGFLVFWLVNSLIFYFVPYVLSSMVVTGNARLTPFMARIISGFLLTAVDAAIEPVFRNLKIKLTSDWQWILAYLFANVFGIWVLARYADLTGVGISNAWVALLLGLILNVAQLTSWKLMPNPKKN